MPCQTHATFYLMPPCHARLYFMLTQTSHWIAEEKYSIARKGTFIHILYLKIPFWIKILISSDFISLVCNNKKTTWSNTAPQTSKRNDKSFCRTLVQQKSTIQLTDVKKAHGGHLAVIFYVNTSRFMVIHFYNGLSCAKDHPDICSPFIHSVVFSDSVSG